MVAAIGPSYPLAFLAGLVSFLSPCVFPLVPVYAAYLGGRASRASQPALLAASATAGRGEGTVVGAQAAVARTPLLANGVAFVAGFMAVFIALFYVLQALEVTFLLHHQVAVDRVAGVRAATVGAVARVRATTRASSRSSRAPSARSRTGYAAACPAPRTAPPSR